MTETQQIDMEKFDIVIVGAGIVGLAHAYYAAQSGLSVAVVERDHQCVGASIRNFGFITVTGQGVGQTWERAMRSRQVWADLAPRAGIDILHSGLWVLAKHKESVPVLEAFMRTEMAQQCTLHTPEKARYLAPYLSTSSAVMALYSPHELRVESNTAIPKLAAYLADALGVCFYWGEEVLNITPPQIATSKRTLQAERVIVCAGAQLNGVAQSALSADSLRLTQLQMLRVMPSKPIKLRAGIMSDLSLVRYKGYAQLSQAQALKQHLSQCEAASLAHGIHLIVVQSADGSLVVGDSHHDADSPTPFTHEVADEIILRHLRETLDLGAFSIQARWTGVYPTGHVQDCIIREPNASTRVVVVSSGTGASTAFGIAQDVLNSF